MKKKDNKINKRIFQFFFLFVIGWVVFSIYYSHITSTRVDSLSNNSKNSLSESKKWNKINYENISKIRSEINKNTSSGSDSGSDSDRSSKEKREIEIETIKIKTKVGLVHS